MLSVLAMVGYGIACSAVSAGSASVCNNIFGGAADKKISMIEAEAGDGEPDMEKIKNTLVSAKLKSTAASCIITAGLATAGAFVMDAFVLPCTDSTSDSTSGSSTDLI